MPTTAPFSRPFLLRNTLLALAALLAWDAGGLDLPLARLFGDAAGFALRDHWLLGPVMHEGGRLLGWLGALLLCLGVWWPRGPLRGLARRHRLQLAVSTLAAALAVSVLKGFSSTSCPQELALFGRSAQYLSHWRWPGTADGGSGHCFPAGHASAGFAFVSGWFAFRRAGLRGQADGWLLAALAAGLLLGLAQQARGAHFMSHTLWSAWLCWVVAWAMDGLFNRQAAGRAAPSCLEP
ncbi:phosphatase PAP2 family protein [Aquincola tertiaricarbonis]|uniref:phosphatase PAP2 family protein n=1 Tax=Aquincola tertiaricarbonis TaxID=391953 RepID=UPI0006153FDC|nr:phosphatase PAP2 family protein [Aquincola tertiaricarbonis]